MMRACVSVFLRFLLPSFPRMRESSEKNIPYKEFYCLLDSCLRRNDEGSGIHDGGGRIYDVTYNSVPRYTIAVYCRPPPAGPPARAAT